VKEFAAFDLRGG
jgi:hypothetical protein